MINRCIENLLLEKAGLVRRRKTSLSPLTNLIQRIKGAVVLKKQQDAVLKFADTYIETLKTFRLKDNTDAKAIYEQYIATKGARDLFLDFCRYCLKRNLTLWMFCVRCSKECIIRSPASMDTTHLHAKQEAVIMRFFIF